MNESTKVRKKMAATALLSAACMLTLLPLYAQSQQTTAEALAKRYPSAIEYIIRRKGKKVGIHSVAFTTNNLGLSVTVESKITVTILKIPVFKFRYTANEQWQNGKLLSVDARTNNGGDITEAQFTPNDNQSATFSSNHWNVNVLEANEVFNTLTGNISNVSIDLIGNETLQDNNDSISANRYRYTGDIQADVWYDDNHRWVKLQFQGEDGSVISYTANPLNLAP